MLTIAAKLFILDVPRVLVKAWLSSVVDYNGLLIMTDEIIGDFFRLRKIFQNSPIRFLI